MNETYATHAEVKAFAVSKINPKETDLTDYRKQVNNLIEHLKDFISQHPDYGFVKTLHSGSVRKGTALKTINDMDVALYVRENEANENDNLKAWLLDKLQEAYPTKSPEDFTIKQHCVNISFIGTGLDVDVVPVIYEDEPDNRGYLLVEETGERTFTSISLHIEFIRKRKNAQHTHFAQVVRLIKWWKKECKKRDDTFRFKSFMIELVCAKLADEGLDMSDYPVALEKIFKYIIQSELKQPIFFTDYYVESDLAEQVDANMQIFDPVNPENNASATYTDFDRNRIVEFAHDAFDAIVEARYSTTKERAESLWKEVLGNSFSIS